MFILILFLSICGAQFFVYATQLNYPLQGIRIVVDCGHGGFDQGASANGVEEAPLNLEIGKRLKMLLESEGAQVIMTRDTDCDLASFSSVHRKREDILKRIEIINHEANDFFISIHMNKYTTSQPQGAQVFYNPVFLVNEKLALMLQQKLNEVSKQNRIIKKGDFLLLNEAKTPGVLVECGFLSNGIDFDRLQQESYQSQLVKGIVGGLKELLENFA